MLSLLLALLFIVTGGAVLADCLYWRLRARRVSGTVIGVQRSQGDSFRAVYQYTDVFGQTVQARSNIASPRLGDKETGATLRLMALPDRPDRVREANAYFIDIVGAVFFAAGVFQLYSLPRSWGAARILGIMAALAVTAGVVVGHARARRSSSDGVEAGLLSSRASAAAVPPTQRAEEIDVERPADSLTVGAAPQRRSSAWKSFLSALFMIALGVGMGTAGLSEGMATLRLEREGLSASGTVVGWKEEGFGRGVSHYAVVRFNTASGTAIQFEDSRTRPRDEYRVGQTVPVLYLANSPEIAIVDNGIWNWALPLVFVGVGALLVVGGVAVLRGWTLARAGSDRTSQPTETPTPGTTAWEQTVTVDDALPLLGRHYKRWAIVLWVIDCALVFAPPSHKTGAAAAGALLFVLVCLMGVVGLLLAIVSFLASAAGGMAAKERMSTDLTPSELHGHLSTSPSGAATVARRRGRPFGRLLRRLWVWALVALLASLALLVVGFLSPGG